MDAFLCCTRRKTSHQIRWILEHYGSASFVGAGSNYLRIGSSDAGGATLGLDGDSNGDGSGADYCMIQHATDGNLKIIADNPANAADTIFYSNSTTERLRIKADGKLGLGTNPQRLVHIHETSAASAYLHMTNGTTGAASTDGFSLYVATDGQTYYRARESTGTHVFYTGTTEKLRIASDGVFYHKPSGATSNTYLKAERSGDTYILKAQKDGAADTNFAISVQDGGSLKQMITVVGGNKHVAIGPDITAARNLHVQEHFVVANKGTNGGQPYVSSTPILAVTTDGSNVVPGDTTYRHNALVSFGVGGHNAGNPGNNALPGLGYFKLDL